MASGRGRVAKWRWTTAVVLLAFGPVACGFWKTVPLTDIRTGEEDVQDVRIKVHPRGAPAKQVLRVTRLDYPFVEGVPVSTEAVTVPPNVVPKAAPEASEPSQEQASLPPGPKDSLRLDLRDMEEIEVFSPGRGAVLTTFGVLGGLALVAGVSFLIVLLTKTSCPFVYVDGPDGPVLIGEAYSGAVTRSTQRDDLMPLPPVDAPRLRLLFTNEALESQLTDRLQLLVVDHPTGWRAVATPTAQVILVEGGHTPARLTDLEGVDVTELALARLWETDMEAVASRLDPPLRSGLEATFAAPAPGTPLVLEMDVANTAFLDVANGRFFAMMDEEDHRSLDTDPRSGPAIWGWRAREGVDLLVEVERDGAWQRVAVVPTVGAVAPRRIGVPLPPAIGSRPVRVRMTGGPGFWRLGRLTLSTLRDDAPASRQLAAVEARDATGLDVRGLLAAVDGLHQVMPRRGDRVQLAFDLPRASPGLSRSVFVLTTGYYLIDPPPDAQPAPRMVATLRSDPGSFRRFSIDLYREYRRIAQGAPVATR